MKLSTQIAYSGGFKQSVARVAEFEKAGLDIAWLAEAYGFDSVSLMGYLAAKTERLTVGSAILPIYTRTPTLLAMTAAGLDELTDGRFILGIGASGPQVVEGWHGVAYDKPLGRTREITEICRAVWAREQPLMHNGPNYTIPLPESEGTGLGKPLKIIGKPRRSNIPIYIAALGGKNIELTAEVADGWLPLFYFPEHVDVFADALAAGKAKRSADLGPLEVVAGGVAYIGDPESCRKVLDAYARPHLALYVGGMGAKGQNFYNALVRRYGYEKEAELIQDLYLSGRKDEAAAAIPEELVRLTNLCGDEGFVRERIQAFRDSGVTTLNLTLPTDGAVGILERLRDWTN